MYKSAEERLRNALREHLRRRYGQEISVAIERPPKLTMGELASPLCFELAKQLKRAPRALAQEISCEIGPIEGIARLEIAGGGYLNAYLDRTAFFRSLARGTQAKPPVRESGAAKIIVEHTSVNPNKAAHIGHLRNAVLGDSFVRLLRSSGHSVEVHNYIDNTGVQVADVVLGFLRLEKRAVERVRELAAGPGFDNYCWELYARVTQFLAGDKSRLEVRAQTLKEIEEGRGAEAEMAEVVATAILRCHLRTFDRLGIDYDLLSRESDILQLRFWDAAFGMLKESGAIELAGSGKNAGCWIMRLPSNSGADAAGNPPADAPAREGAEPEEPPEEAEAKIIVRSNGTVTYVGKDIAYHLWKFGLLDRDFRYRVFHRHTDGHEAWITASEGGEAGAPRFGRATDVFNVIDSRQAYPQQVVAAGLRALGYAAHADRLKHFAYNVVALTPRCAREMGYEIAPEDAKKPYIEVSGRKGQGVKADELMNRLEAAARKEVDARHAELPESERGAIADAIATGALRYFLLRFTRSTAIAFDFHDALSFEGETGPYAQYAVVRVNGILRKAEADTRLAAENTALIERLRRGDLDPASFLAAPAGDDLWELALLAGSLDACIETALSAQEPAFIARYAFELAQAFNVFYHRRHILSEENGERRAFLLLLTRIVREQLVSALALLGISAPERM